MTHFAISDAYTRLAVTSSDTDTNGYDSVVDFFLELWRTVQQAWADQSS